MKNILITDDCLVAGEHKAAGTIIENAPNDLAAALITSGRAVIAPSAPPLVRVADPEPTHRDIEVAPSRATAKATRRKA
jgi:hypothetical protein